MPQRVTRKGKAAVSLRIAGATLEDVVEQLGYPSLEAARRDIERTLAEGATEEDRRNVRQLMSARYERMLNSVWKQATDEFSSDQLAYQRQATTLVDRLVALHGAAAPSEVIITSPTTRTLMEWVSKVDAAGMPDVIEAEVVDLPVLEATPTAVEPPNE